MFYPPSGADRPALEVFSLLSAIAAREPGLHVGTLVTRVTLRAPGLLAKQAAALDAMSHGRAVLGIGTGDRASAEEHERFGFPFPPAAERIETLEETVEALRSLFGGRTWPGGRHVPAMTGPLLPPGEPAIWVGGLSDAVLEVAARVADAWNGWGLDADAFAARASTLRSLAARRVVAPTWAGIALVGEDAGRPRPPARRAGCTRPVARRRLERHGRRMVRSSPSSSGRPGPPGASCSRPGPPDRLDVIAAATTR